MTIADLAESVRSGQVTSVDLVRESQAATDRLDPLLGTFLARFDESALATADQIDAAVVHGDRLGPLAGVPIGVKDFIATREGPTTGQSMVYDPSWSHGRDAEVVRRLRNAGAIVLGKTTMVEHAAGRPDPAKPFPVPRNPWDVRRFTGGSSAGTANGIAAGLFPAGLGTDTSGSMRIPAAMCGITGLKTTRGLVPTDGCLPASPSLDVVGPMAHSAADLTVMLSVMSGEPVAAGPTVPADLHGIRIGVPWTILTDPSREIGDDCRAAFRRATTDLAAAGAEIVDFDLGEIDRMIAATMIIMISEMYRVHSQNLTQRWDEYGRSIRRLAAAGALVSTEADRAARAYGRRRGAELIARMEGLDAVATPTWPTGAPLYQSGGGIPQQEFNLTAAWNATGFPALALPMGFDHAGMPLSLQLVGTPHTDFRLLQVGAGYQQCTDWHNYRPSPDASSNAEPVPDLDEGLDQNESEIIAGIGRMLADAATTLTTTTLTIPNERHSMNFVDEATTLQPGLVALRRKLHAAPEVGLDLPETQKTVLDELAELGLEITLGKKTTSIAAVLRGGKPGPVVLLRGDMDALPVTELTDLEYASTNGAMHACGHDLHTAGLVGAAKLLAAHRDELPGSVLFMFQPGEEGEGGAKIMLDEGLLELAGERPVAAYAIHVGPGEQGKFVTRSGTAMAGANKLWVTMQGSGGHGSQPDKSIDPVPPLAEMVTGLQTIATRRFSVFDPIVVTVTQLAAGEAINVIPDSSKLGATVRTLSNESVEQFRKTTKEMADGIAAAHGCTAHVELDVSYPVTVNDPDATDRTVTTLQETFGDDRVIEAPDPRMGSEDFSFVLQEVPGTFVFLHATPEGMDPESATNHSPRVYFDDAVLADQAAALAQLATTTLDSWSKPAASGNE
jgi:hippurate hydrolase